MRVRDVMHRCPVTVTEDEDVGVALQMMLWTGIRHLPVVRDGTLTGVLSHRDVLRHRGAEGPWRVAGSVRDAMTHGVATVGPDEPLEAAAARLADEHIGCLPVVSEGRLLGILTTTDLVTLVARGGAAPVEAPPLESVMVTEPETARPDEYLLDAASRMFHRGVRHLPVVEAGRVVGMLSDRDVRSAVGNPLGKLREELRVADAMTHEPSTVRADAPLSNAVELLLDERVGALPVVGAEGRLVGMVSYMDVLRFTAERLGLRRRVG